MNNPDTTIQYYSIHADRFYQRYTQLKCEEINSHWVHLVSSGKMRVLDVGAGSGRDALWLAQRGHTVIAVEPADGLRQLAQKNISDDSIRWVKDSLPGLLKVKRFGIKFELILLNAVWMHMAPQFRKEAFHSLIQLLNNGGKLVITLRNGPSPDTRVMHPVCKEELIHLAEAKKIERILDVKSDDLFGRTDVSWETIVFLMPENRMK